MNDDFDKILTEEKLVLEKVLNAFNKNENLLLSYLNQSTFNIYVENNKFKRIMDEHFFVHLDGIGIYWALKLLNVKNAHLYNGTDLNEKIITLLVENNILVFIIGGKFLEAEIQVYSTRQKLNIVGYQNGFFKESDFEHLIQKINNSKAQAVLIGMGVPKQELLAFKLSKRINVNLIHCVGNFFEFSLGKRTRAPKLLRNKGMEWLFRLITEPKRLWKRYLVGIPVFILRIIRMKFNM